MTDHTETLDEIYHMRESLHSVHKGLRSIQAGLRDFEIGVQNLRVAFIKIDGIVSQLYYKDFGEGMDANFDGCSCMCGEEHDVEEPSLRGGSGDPSFTSDSKSRSGGQGGDGIKSETAGSRGQPEAYELGGKPVYAKPKEMEHGEGMLRPDTKKP